MNESISIKNYGVIGAMRLPNGWWEWQEPTTEARNPSTIRTFVYPDNTEVQICLHSRGLPVSGESSQEFHSLLQKAPHQLLPGEIARVGPVLDRVGLPTMFEAVSIRTEVLNEKVVLIAEGRWIHIQFDFYGIYVDADGTGSFVEEIYYAAPRDVYAKHLAEAKLALKSIAWQNVSTNAGRKRSK